MSQPDPLLAARLHADNRFRRGEAAVYSGVIAAMTIWLDTARALVLHRPIPAAAVALLEQPLTAAADGPTPDIDNVRAATEVWARAVREHVEPALTDAFGEAFLDAARRADYSPLPFQLAYLEQVHDRLRIWPEGAFEELRPELLEMLSEGMSIDQVEERIGRLLDIDAPSRRARAEISEIDRQIADPETPRADLPGLRAQRRALWNQHDESLGEWQWLARRIARTEIHGAIEGGSLAAAQAVEQAIGAPMFKRWLATTDTRVRGSHAVADGQIVKLAEPFTIGRAELQHPGEAGGPAHEVINCRCTMLVMERDEVDEALAGPLGNQGVRPGSIREGPDDPDEVAIAIRRWLAEQRGEPFDEVPEDDEPDADPDPVELDPDEDVDPPPDLDDEDDEPRDPDDDIEIIIEDDGDEDDPVEDDDPDPVDEDPDAEDDNELVDEDEDEPEPPGILSRVTAELIEDVRRSQPDDDAAWRQITAEREIRPRETLLERSIAEIEEILEHSQTALDKFHSDPQWAQFDRDDLDMWEHRRKLERRIEELEAKLARSRAEKSIQRWTTLLGPAREELDAWMRYERAVVARDNALNELTRLREDPPTSEHWSQVLAAKYGPAYVQDDNGKLLPPPELDAQLDAVLEVGEAVLRDIQEAFDRDDELESLRAALAAVSWPDDAKPQRRAVAAREAAIVRAAMVEAREFGGFEQRARLAPARGSASASGRQRDLDDLRAAETLFPQDWLRAADRRGELALCSNRRAFFQEGLFGGDDLIAGSRTPLDRYDGGFADYEGEVMAHELGHRMEQAIPGLMQLEFAYVRRRATNADGNLEERRLIYEGSTEYALADRWLNPYAGKVYGWTSFDPARQPHEVFQVGLQDLLGRSRDAFNGLQLQAFMLGVMLTI
uniref:phage minor head protein n=1 Tax=Micromonospora sp. NBC_00855 TaxID=2975978 RepID=UPI00225A85CF|nr:phage minor head protein [Micromonospora sp. NBC_00855]